MVLDRVRSFLRAEWVASWWLGVVTGVTAGWLVDAFADAPGFAPWLVGFSVAAAVHYRAHYPWNGTGSMTFGRFYGRFVASWFFVWTTPDDAGVAATLAVAVGFYALYDATTVAARRDVLDPLSAGEAFAREAVAADDDESGLVARAEDVVAGCVRESLPGRAWRRGREGVLAALREDGWLARGVGAVVALSSWFFVDVIVGVPDAVALVAPVAVGPLVYYRLHYEVPNPEVPEAREFLRYVSGWTAAYVATPPSASLLARVVTIFVAIALLDLVTVVGRLDAANRLDAADGLDADSGAGDGDEDAASSSPVPPWRRSAWRSKNEDVDA